MLLLLDPLEQTRQPAELGGFLRGRRACEHVRGQTRSRGLRGTRLRLPRRRARRPRKRRRDPPGPPGFFAFAFGSVRRARGVPAAVLLLHALHHQRHRVVVQRVGVVEARRRRGGALHLRGKQVRERQRPRERLRRVSARAAAAARASAAARRPAPLLLRARRHHEWFPRDGVEPPLRHLHGDGVLDVRAEERRLRARRVQLLRQRRERAKPLLARVVHARVPKRPERASESSLVRLGDGHFLLRAERRKRRRRRAVRAHQRVRALDADARHVRQEIASAQNAQLEEPRQTPPAEVQRRALRRTFLLRGGLSFPARLASGRGSRGGRVVILRAGGSPVGVAAGARVRLGTRRGLPRGFFPHVAPRVVPAPRAPRGTGQDVCDVEFHRGAVFVELEQHRRTPVRDEIAVLGEDDVDAPFFASAELRERGDLRVRLVRRDHELEPLPLQRGDELVRHRGGHVETLREEKRGAVLVPDRHLLVAFPHALRAPIAALFLLAALRGQPIAVEHDHRRHAEVPQHLRAVHAVPHVRRVAPLLFPVVILHTEVVRAAVHPFVQPRVRVDGGSLAPVPRHFDGDQVRLEHLGQALDAHGARVASRAPSRLTSARSFGAVKSSKSELAGSP